jgi:hypothetical protein
VNWFEFDFVDDNGNKKTIELFGEEHNMEGLCSSTLKCMRDSKSQVSNCEDINYLLENLFEDAVKEKIHVDFFIEAPYNIYKKDIYETKQDNYLSIIFNHFYECFTVKKEKCKYLPYVRMNYSDLRSSTYFVTDENLKSKHFTIIDFIRSKVMELYVNIQNYPNSQWSRDKIVKTASFINLMLDNIFRITDKLFIILLLKDNYKKLYDNIFDQIITIMLNNPERFDPSDIKELKESLNTIYGASKVSKDSPDVRQFIIKRQFDELRKEKVNVGGENVADKLIDYFVFLIQDTIKNNYDIIQNLWKDLFKNIMIWNAGYNDLEDLDKEPTTSKNTQTLIYKRSQLDSELSNLTDVIVDMSLDFYRNFSGLVTVLDSYYLDSYILARMFRSFSDKNPSRVSIVYAGSSHINTQYDFFTKILNMKPNPYPNVIKGKKSYRCWKTEDFSKIFDIERFK